MITKICGRILYSTYRYEFKISWFFSEALLTEGKAYQKEIKKRFVYLPIQKASFASLSCIYMVLSLLAHFNTSLNALGTERLLFWACFYIYFTFGCVRIYTDNDLEIDCV